ncbi:MAG: hypothetical protein RLZ25_1168 [Pseudomonadota bacterium]|jgi:hypothetical protein
MQAEKACRNQHGFALRWGCEEELGRFEFVGRVRLTQERANPF